MPWEAWVLTSLKSCQKRLFLGSLPCVEGVAPCLQNTPNVLGAWKLSQPLQVSLCWGHCFAMKITLWLSIRSHSNASHHSMNEPIARTLMQLTSSVWGSQVRHALVLWERCPNNALQSILPPCILKLKKKKMFKNQVKSEIKSPGMQRMLF